MNADFQQIKTCEVTQHNQGIPDKSRNTDQREQDENRSRNRALEIVVEDDGLVVPVKCVGEVAAHFAKHVYAFESPLHELKAEKNKKIL